MVYLLVVPLFIAVLIAQIVCAPFTCTGLLFMTFFGLFSSIFLAFNPIGKEPSFRNNSFIFLMVSILCFTIAFLFWVKPEIIPKHLLNAWMYVFFGIGFIYFKMSRVLDKLDKPLFPIPPLLNDMRRPPAGIRGGITNNMQTTHRRSVRALCMRPKACGKPGSAGTLEDSLYIL